MFRGRADGKAWRNTFDRTLKMRHEEVQGQQQPLCLGALLYDSSGWRGLLLTTRKPKSYNVLWLSPKGLFLLRTGRGGVCGTAMICRQRISRRREESWQPFERLPVFTLKGSGKFRARDEHIGFVRERFATNPESRDSEADEGTAQHSAPCSAETLRGRRSYGSISS